MGAAALIVLALATAGCGDEDGASETSVATAAPSRLTTEEVALIHQTERAVGRYCRQVAAALARGGAPHPESFMRVTASLERLATLADAKPESEGPGGTSPRLALGDIAENLEGTNCDSRLVARIDEALAQIP